MDEGNKPVVHNTSSQEERSHLNQRLHFSGQSHAIMLLTFSHTRLSQTSLQTGLKYYFQGSSQRIHQASSIIKGKLLGNNFMLATEFIKGFKRKSGTKKLASKIDISNTFDKVDWFGFEMDSSRNEV
ncbi:hypothetical protein ZOSMA_216G00190 [Zostera marina]|uniref:Uncharacterized protein n=1 Tax=Zostera marina TaxID=29655 RepID=A0A0K9PK55_ZOSMR|nr:hypothetical protein ZOSMA_216G00190 [Zostera marina]